ncbi:hypothetical protein [Paenibacillus dendrobii]|uniref:hypothetical protein n=1 Tax=Paenibacillus dendrobii TaxID=2691084 RepID=UPI001F32269B|nr:hypothetical protein [Paenibacillus dendrobii]
MPEWGGLFFGEHRVHADYSLKYFTKGSPAYKLNEFLFNKDNHEQGYARRRFFEVVLLFEDSLEKDAFLEYVHHYKDDYLKRLAALDGEWSWIELVMDRVQHQTAAR